MSGEFPMKGSNAPGKANPGVAVPGLVGTKVGRKSKAKGTGPNKGSLPTKTGVRTGVMTQPKGAV